MKIEIDNNMFDIVILKKRSTRNTYIRVKDDLKIYVTCNYLTTNHYISNLINDNIDSIKKMIKRQINLKNKMNDFYYLGKKYDIVYTNDNKLILGESKVFIGNDVDINKWYKNEAELIFKNELDKMYNNYLYNIPYPSLAIRTMKSRWGVCNTKNKKITLNLELIKRNLECLDYVIIHELSHLIHPNHSISFWNCVLENMPDYKRIRKELKDDK